MKHSTYAADQSMKGQKIIFDQTGGQPLEHVETIIMMGKAIVEDNLTADEIESVLFAIFLQGMCFYDEK